MNIIKFNEVIEVYFYVFLIGRQYRITSNGSPRVSPLLLDTILAFIRPPFTAAVH